MAEVLVEYPDPIEGEDGRIHYARACAAPMSEHSWQGWIEFIPADGGTPVRSPRETTQPNLTDAHYWATGLTPVYLEGALKRALHPLVLRTLPPSPEPIFDGPASDFDAAVPDPAQEAPADAVLNPFSVYLKGGETLLRRQLSALSDWHLANIVRAYRIRVNGLDPDRLPPSELIDAIALAARKRTAAPVAE